MTALTTASGSQAHRSAPRLNGTLGAAIAFFTVVLLIVVVGPLLLPSPTHQNLENSLASPSASALLGTDQLGRDVLARVLAGMRLDLLVGVGALIVPILLGSLVGALAAWRGGWVDEVVGIVADVVQAFPYYLFILVLAFFLGAGVTSIFVAVAAVAWVSYMRIVRAEVHSAMRQDYVQAAVGAGYSGTRVLLRHILPNAFKQPLTYAVTDVVVVIVSTATLSYLGVGVTPPTPELGSMVADGQQFVGLRPLLTIAPGLAVVLIGAALALLGNGLSRQLDES
jgi:peptide/nickel transport system permease protein